MKKKVIRVGGGMRREQAAGTCGGQKLVIIFLVYGKKEGPRLDLKCTDLTAKTCFIYLYSDTLYHIKCV